MATTEEAVREQKRIVASLRENLEDYFAELGKIEGESIELFSLERAIHRAAYNASMDRISNSAIDFLINKAIQACIKTEEYNYDLFLEQFELALRANQDHLIYIEPSENMWLGTANVRIDMTPLGDIEEYAKAVEQTRKALDVGKIPDPTVRSVIWEEKIYGVDREGGTVLDHDGEDITERYRGKYRETIEQRLNLLGHDKAPFWYLIEHGNAMISSMDKGGDPYPTFPGTHFVEETRLLIEAQFKQLYRYFHGVAENNFSKILAEGRERERLERIGRETYEYSRKESLNKLNEQYIESISMGIHVGKIEVKEMGTRGRQLLERIKVDDSIWEYYATTRGRVIRSVRSPVSGQFIKLD